MAAPLDEDYSVFIGSAVLVARMQIELPVVLLWAAVLANLDRGSAADYDLCPDF
jgi:hypothetical protein